MDMFLRVTLFGFSFICLGCNGVRGYPPEVAVPQITRPLAYLQVEGFDAGVGYVAKPLAKVTPEGTTVVPVEIPRLQGRFIEVLESYHLAEYYTPDPVADFTVKGTWVWSKGGARGMSDLIFGYGRYLILPLFFPWNEKAIGEVVVEISDRKGHFSEEIRERCEIQYDMWILPFFQGRDAIRGAEVRAFLLSQAARQTVHTLNSQGQ